MSNISIRSEKSDSSQSGGTKAAATSMEVIHTKDGPMPSHKVRLHELFSLIDKEFDALYEENLELKAKLAALTGGPLPLPASIQPLRKQGVPLHKRRESREESSQLTVLSASNESIGITSTNSKSQGSNALGKLRFVKLTQKNKTQKQKGPGHKYVMVKEFKEHRDGIWEVSSCPWDVGYFATASADHSARVCFADGSRASVVYLAHMGSVNSIRFHPVDRLVCTASGDKSCHIWKLPQPQVKPPSSVNSDKRESRGEAGTGTAKPRPKPWTPILGHGDEDNNPPSTPGTSPTLTHPFLHDSSSRPSSGQLTGPLVPSTSVPISIPSNATEKIIGSHEASPTNELEDAATITEASIVVRSALLELKGHTAPVVAASWTSSNSVATASWDHTVRVWSADNGRVVSTLVSNHDKSYKITNVNTHPTSSIVLYSVTDGSFRVWDYRNTPDKPEVVTAHQGPIATAIFSGDGNTILSGGEDRTVKIWDLRNYKSPKVTIRCHSAINRLGISPTSQYVVIPTDGKRSSIYDINGARVGKFYNYEKTGHKSMVTSAAWSSDESVIFTTGFDRRVIAWGQT